MQTLVAGTSAAVFDWLKCRHAAALVSSSSTWVRAQVTLAGPAHASAAAPISRHSPPRLQRSAGVTSPYQLSWLVDRSMTWTSPLKAAQSASRRLTACQRGLPGE